MKWSFKAIISVTKPANVFWDIRIFGLLITMEPNFILLICGKCGKQTA